MLGLVLRRIRPHRLLLAAALCTAVLTACVIATLTAFEGAVDTVGLRQALGQRDAGRAVLDVTAELTAAQLPEVDRVVRAAGAAAYSGLPSATNSSEQSGPYGLPAALHPGGAQTELTMFATFDRSRMVLTAGSWPGAGGSRGAVPVVLEEAAARELGLRPGARFAVTDRTDGGAAVPVLVTGVYRPSRSASAYWGLDPLLGRGSRTDGGFTTYGPLVTDPRVFGSGRLAPAAMAWQTTADFGGLTPAGIGRLRSAVQHAVSTLSGQPVAGSTVQAQSELPDALGELQRAMGTGRTAVLISVLQLAVLALGALLLVAGLLVGARAEETEVLRARGASRWTLAGLALGEAGLLAVPAGVAGALLAPPLARLLAAHGALGGAGAGARVGSAALKGAEPGAWAAAAAVALACVLALVLPGLRRVGTHTAERSARLRPGRVTGMVRAGGDLALVALAAIAYWQVRERASGQGVLTAGGSGGPGIDPVLVVAPALCLLAGTVLAQRLLPFAARLGERVATRGRGLEPALVGRQLARRPQRVAMPALLLALAVAMGVLAIGQYASRQRSERDQAAFSVGADLRVTGSVTQPFGQGGVYDAFQARHLGITGAAAANRSSVALPQDRTATVLATDTRTAARTLRMRGDLTGGRSLPGLLRPLYAAQDAPADRESGGIPVPADSRSLLVTVRLETLDPAGHDLPGGPPESLAATLEDRYDNAAGLLLGTVPADGRSHVLGADLAAVSGAPDGSPAGPLRITRIDAGHGVQPRDQQRRLTVSAVRAVGADGKAAPLAVPSAGSGSSPWRAAVSVDVGDGSAPVPGAPGYRAPRAETAASGPLSIDYDLGAVPAGLNSQAPPTGRLTLTAADPAPPPVDGIATDAFLRASGARPGQDVPITLSGTQVNVHLTAAVRELPTTDGSTDQGGGALLLDLRAVNRELDAEGAAPLAPGEWWLGTAPGAQSRVAAALRSAGLVDSLLSQDEQLAALRSDPFGAAAQSALPAEVVAAALLAAAGFAIGALRPARERSAEFAVLRALGASRAGIARIAAAELGMPVVLALVVGTLLGVLTTRLVVPLVVLTEQAARPVPPLLVELPGARLAAVVAAVLGAPVLVVAVVAVRRWRG